MVISLQYWHVACNQGSRKEMHGLTLSAVALAMEAHLHAGWPQVQCLPVPTCTVTASLDPHRGADANRLAIDWDGQPQQARANAAPWQETAGCGAKHRHTNAGSGSSATTAAACRLPVCRFLRWLGKPTQRLHQCCCSC